MIPRTFEAWKDCIVNDCKINLTKQFAAQRLSIYQDRSKAETKKIISLYGEEHLNNLVQWFQQIRKQ